jgi:hypothetical protein
VTGAGLVEGGRRKRDKTGPLREKASAYVLAEPRSIFRCLFESALSYVNIVPLSRGIFY